MKSSQQPNTDVLEADNQIQQIDIDAVLRSRIGKYYRFIPRFLVSKLAKLIRQEQFNWLIRHNAGKTGAEFCSGVLADLDVSTDFHGAENLPAPADTRVVFISNHPLGGLDGMALIEAIGRHYGRNPQFIVNDLLTAIKPLSNVFLPINKHGTQSRQAVADIEKAFESDAPIIIFPAGLVSRRQKGGRIEDLRWQKMFVTKSRQYQRDIIPLHFCGENSPFFYKFAKFRKRLGLKFNIEMIYLPREVFRCANTKFKVVVGERIPWQQMANGESAQATADRLHRLVYSLD